MTFSFRKHSILIYISKFCFLLPCLVQASGKSQLYIMKGIECCLPAHKVFNSFVGSIMFASIWIIPFNTIPLTYKVHTVLSFNQSSPSHNSISHAKLNRQQLKKSLQEVHLLALLPASSLKDILSHPFMLCECRFCSKIIYSKKKGKKMKDQAHCD